MAGRNHQDQSNSPRTQDPSSVPPDQAKQDQDYLVALKRCEEMQDAAIQGGMLTMQIDGFIKALRGETTIEEVLRVTSEE